MTMRTLTLALVLSLAGTSGQWWRWFRPAPTTGTSQLLQHVSCAGKFRIATPQNGGGAFFNAGIHGTMRYDTVDGKRHYFSITSGGAVWEAIEPTLSSCDTSNDVLNFATAPSWGTGPDVPPGSAGDSFGSNWGPFPFASATTGDGWPNDGSVQYVNARWDAISGKMLAFWATGYSVSNDHPGNLGLPTVGAATMNFTTHTFEPFGCWTTYPNQIDVQAGSGVIFPPSSWVAANSGLLPAGNTNYWLVGLGGPGFYNPTMSNGPSLILQPAPTSGNACTPGGSYPFAAGAVLSNHQTNPNGPVCLYDQGCLLTGGVPAGSPTHPYPHRMAFTGYSGGVYDRDWEPTGGLGWFTSTTLYGLDWVTDLGGIFLAYTTPSGYRQGTILASPAPTFNAGTLTMSWAVDAIDAHDGYPIHVNDNAWATSCVVGTDAGCASGNLNDHTGGYITSITGTGPYVITIHADNLDPSSGAHVPVVGAGWHFGPTYGHGDTGDTYPRMVARAQFINPAEYVKVLNGTYATADLPTYTEDVDATTLFKGLGGPSTGQGISNPGSNYESWPFNVIADNPHHNVVVVFGGGNPGNCPAYHYCSTVYILETVQ